MNQSVWVYAPILLGCACLCANDLLRRKVLTMTSASGWHYMVCAFGMTTATFGLIYLGNWGFSLPQHLPGYFQAAFGLMAINLCIQTMNALAAKKQEGEVSLTAPLQALTPGVVAILAIMLGEFPSTKGWCGIALMMLGSWVLLLEEKLTHWTHYLGPLRYLAKLFRLASLEEKEKNRTVVVAMCFVSACGGSIGLLCNGLVTRKGLNAQGLILSGMILTAGVTVFALILCLLNNKHRVGQAGSTAATGILGGFRPLLQRKSVLCLLGISLAWVGSVYFIDMAYLKAYVVYVGSLKRLYIPMSVCLGFLLFKEQQFKQRFWAAIIIVLGALLIAADDLPARLTANL